MNRKHHTRRRRIGFTLIELIIAIALLMIVMLMIMQMFLSAQALYRIAAERSDAFSQARAAMDVIESDLQRLRVDFQSNLLALSIAPQPGHPEGATDITDPAHYQRLYQSTANERPNNQMSSNILPFLSMYVDSASWYDRLGRFQTGPAQITYYLKKRPARSGIGGAREGEQPASSFLMRYVVPVRLTIAGAEIDPNKDLEGAHVEVASSVIAARVWAWNNAAPSYMIQTGQDYEVFPRMDETPTGSAGMMRDTRVAAGDEAAQKAQRAIEEQRQKQGQAARPVAIRPGKTYSWGAEPGSVSQYIRSRGNFPLALAIELTIANEGMYEVLGEFNGTARTVRRVIALPNTQAVSALTEKEMQEHFSPR